jgi:hypothetical protein
MLRAQNPKVKTPSNFFCAILSLAAWISAPAYADTAYRCGNAYSTSIQCSQGVATEVLPPNVLRTTRQDKTNATADLQEAQTLEKQRLQAERQTTQANSIRIFAATEPLLPNENNKGKHSSKAPSPFFTAVDPHAAPKKKSTAKAVPNPAATSP